MKATKNRSAVQAGQQSFRLHAKRGVAAVVGASLFGCSVMPTPIDTLAHRDRLMAEITEFYRGQDRIDGPLTVHSATARAIQYNLEYRLKSMDQALALGQLEVGRYDMLPKLTMSAGYSWRNNESFGYGFDPSGRVSTNPSASQERIRDTASAGLSWSVLDFGLSYLRAKQLADQTLVAEERKRKSLQNLVFETRQAFWRGEAAERLLPQIRELLAEVDRVSAKADQIARRKLVPPLQILAYRRSLLDLEQQLSVRAQDLAQAQNEFAALINLPAGMPVRLVAEPQPARQPVFAGNINVLESLAITFRPELREEGYRERLSDLEAVRNRLSLFLPGFTIDTGANYDSNSYLLNQSWLQLGLNAGLNLFRAISLPAVNRAAGAQKEVDNVRRLSQSAAVLAQVRIAVARHDLAVKELEYWNESVEDDRRILETLDASRTVGLEADLEVVRAKARLLLSTVNRDLVHASVQGARARIYNSVGLDIATAADQSLNADRLSKAIQARSDSWESANFARTASNLPAAVRLEFPAGLPAEAVANMRSAAADVFAEANIPIDERSTRVVQIEADSSKATEIMRSVRLRARLLDERGGTMGQMEQRSTMVEPVTPMQWRALGEAVAYGLSDSARNAGGADKAPPAVPPGMNRPKERQTEAPVPRPEPQERAAGDGTPLRMSKDFMENLPLSLHNFTGNKQPTDREGAILIASLDWPHISRTDSAVPDVVAETDPYMVKASLLSAPSYPLYDDRAPESQTAGTNPLRWIQQKVVVVWSYVKGLFSR